MEREDIAAGGTAPQDAGSGAEAASVVAGDEGATPEPGRTIKVGEREVDEKTLANALKAHDRFTQISQELAERRRELERREQEIASVYPLLERIADPNVRQRLIEQVPEVAEYIPDRASIETQRLLAENIELKFSLFAQQNADTFDDDMLEQVKRAALEYARAGRVDEALDFEGIGYRLFSKQIVEKRAQEAAKKLLERERQREESAKRSGVAPPAAPELEGEIDPSKLTPVQLMALARKKRR